MKYPIYIPSKGRASNQRTVKLLESQGITNYYVIVEKNEKTEYEKFVGKEHILVLPASDYGTSTFARNFAIEHSAKNGHKKHWQIDDDVNKLCRHRGGKVISEDIEYVLTNVEIISDSYPTVSITGLHFFNFLKDVKKAVTVNTMVSGVSLITNTSIRFRGVMYVDRDFVLQSLKKGYTTIKCNDFSFTYIATLKQKGGYYNVYSDDKRRLAAIKEFLSYHPEIDATVERHPLGFLHLKNIAGIWRKYQKK